MKIIVVADENQKNEILCKKVNEDITFEFVNNFLNTSENDADGFLILAREIKLEQLAKFSKKHVFINEVTTTLSGLQEPENFHRLNGWPTFLQRDVWEIATNNENSVKQFFNEAGWEYILVKDEPGLVSARIIAMIINEAYFALGDKVSTKSEIDIAMKLGTNYPYGPFEWCEKIGIANVYDLLATLSKNDNRYSPAPEFEKEVLTKK